MRGTGICVPNTLDDFSLKKNMGPIALELQDPSDYVLVNIESIFFLQKDMVKKC